MPWKNSHFLTLKGLFGIMVLYKWANARDKYERTVFSGSELNIWEGIKRRWYSESRKILVKMLSDWNNPGDLLKHQKKKRVSKCLENIENRRRISQEIKDTLRVYIC